MGRGSIVRTPNDCPGMLERVQHSYEPLPTAEPACGLKESPIRPQLCPKELSKHGACLRISHAGGWHMSSHFPIPSGTTEPGDIGRNWGGGTGGERHM